MSSGRTDFKIPIWKLNRKAEAEEAVMKNSNCPPFHGKIILEQIDFLEVCRTAKLFTPHFRMDVCKVDSEKKLCFPRETLYGSSGFFPNIKMGILNGNGRIFCCKTTKTHNNQKLIPKLVSKFCRTEMHQSFFSTYFKNCNPKKRGKNWFFLVKKKLSNLKNLWFIF